MDIDFAFWLFIATVVTGIAWLICFIFRKKAIAKGANNQSWYLPKIQFLGSFFPVLILVFSLRSFAFEPFVIPSGSMLPGLLVGDFILTSKFAYGLRLPVLNKRFYAVNLPKRGEVMVFVPPHQDNYFIKRVIGLPGDHVTYRNKNLYINGQKVNRDFVSQHPPLNYRYRHFSEQLGDNTYLVKNYDTTSIDGEWRVPEGHYFVMGDNRDKSLDSRSWGFVPENQVVGRAVYIWMNKKPGWNLPSFARFGKSI